MQTRQPSCPQTGPAGPEPVFQGPKVQGHASVLHPKEVQLGEAWTFLGGRQALSTHFQEITRSLEESTFCFESGYMKVGPVRRCGLYRGPQDTMDWARSHRQRLVSGAHVQRADFSQTPGLHVSGLHQLPELMRLLLSHDCPTQGKNRWRRGEERGEGGKKEERKEGWREGKKESRDQGESERHKDTKEEKSKEKISLGLCKNHNLTHSQHPWFEETWTSALFISEQ